MGPVPVGLSTLNQTGGTVKLPRGWSSHEHHRVVRAVFAGKAQSDEPFVGREKIAGFDFDVK